MGQKRGGRFGRFTGTTLRRIPGTYPLFNLSSGVGLITKQIHSDDRDGLFYNSYSTEEKIDVLNEFKGQFDDGGIEYELRGQGYTIPYSLNKHRRWELPNLLRDNIAFDCSHETNEFEVVLVERSWGLLSSVSTDCIGIHKSKGDIRSKKPRGKYAQEHNLMEAEQNARVSDVQRNSGCRKKRKIQLESIDKPTPNLRLKYEVTYERSREQFPSFRQRPYNRHTRDSGKVLCTNARKERHNMFLSDLEEDESYYSDHFDTDDGYLGDEESLVYLHAPELLMGAPTASVGDYLKLSYNKRQKSQRSKKGRTKKSLRCDETTYSSRKDHKVVLNTADTSATDIETSNVVDTSSSLPSHMTSPDSLPALPSQSILITKSSVTPEYLETTFKSEYAEGASHPRRFVIDVTSHLHDILHERRKSKVVKHLENISQRIVIVFTTDNNEPESFVNYTVTESDGVSLEEVDEFRIRLIGLDDQLNNTGDLLMNALSNTRSFSITDVIAIVKTVIDQLPENQFYTGVKTSKDAMSHFTFNSLQDHLQQVSEVMTPHDLYQRNTTKETPKILNAQLVQPNACGICYVDLPLSSGGISATALTSCQHWFCDDCWRYYIMTRVGRGDSSILCPEYRCDNIVDATTLMSLMSTEQFQQHTAHKQNRIVDSDPAWNWCPEPGCGHVGRVHESRDDLGFVPCKCGKSWCVGCKENVHWPALCQQAEEYIKSIKKREVDKRCHKITMVRVKRCPHCNRMMEKNGGCPNMTCICGKNFCWACLKPHNYSPSCNQSGPTYEIIELYPVMLGVTKDEILAKAIDFRKFTSRSVIARIKRDAIQLFTKMHAKAVRKKTANKNQSTSTVNIICNCRCSNTDEHIQIYTEAVTMADDIAQFYTETYHLLEWTYVFMAYLSNDKMKDLSHLSTPILFILEMLNEIVSKRRTHYKMADTKKSLQQLLANGKKWRQVLYECASRKRMKKKEKQQ